MDSYNLEPRLLQAYRNYQSQSVWRVKNPAEVERPPSIFAHKNWGQNPEGQGPEAGAFVLTK